ncbi:Wzz/FepE/Etk N-terminal domain-containing protein [Caldisericum sp.]|uniref:Wzz/FepE/Etk N-terminal domain-containing protein n=1 Tax=Caldisericum sp. TaxID=2499687 RepID=UPI003D12886A
MQENEASLKSFILTLLKYKYFIVGLTVFAIFVSGVLNFFVLKPVYSGSGIVYLAQVNGNLLLKAKDVQTQTTSENFIQKIAQDLGVESKVISKALNVATSQDSKFILVSFESEDKDLITRFFPSFITELNSFNSQAYQNQIGALNDQKSTLSQEVSSLEKQGEDVFTRLKALEQNGASNAEYVLEYTQLRGVYDSIVSKKVQLINQISQIDLALKISNSFFYQSNPLILDTPVKPHKLFNTALAGLIAFCFGILLALFLEYWQKS